MAIKAIQQFQLRTVIGTEAKAKETLRLMEEAGYDGIELCSYMIKHMSLTIRAITRLAGMPMGKSGNLDWHALLADTNLKVVSIHQDLGTLKRVPEEAIAEAKSYGTKYIVITGMHHFDYSDKEAVDGLIADLNACGKRLKADGIELLYHNHNCEFRKIDGQTAYDRIIENTDPEYVNFEFDSYWPTEAGVNTVELMRRLGSRIKLYHINDRGSRVEGKTSSILTSDSMELGYGNMDLKTMVDIVKENGVDAVVLESHKNWVDKSPIKSFQLSAKFMNENVLSCKIKCDKG